jgi:NADH dehydrogenase
MELTSTPSCMEPSGKKCVVIAGGGYAGVTLAVRLAKRAKPADNLDIMLLEPNPCQQSLSELDLVAVGPPRPEFCELWLPSLFKDLPVTVCYNRLHDVFPHEHRLVIGPRSGPHEPVHYHRLVLATGAVAFVPPVPGLKEHAVTMWSVRDAQELQRRLDAQFRAAAMMADHDARVRALSVAVIGAGATGIEIVGTLGERLTKRAAEQGLDPKDLRIRIIEGRPDILYDLPQPQRERAKRRLAKLGVELVTGSMVERVDASAVYLADGSTIDASVLCFCGGAKPDPDAVSWDLPFDPSGRLVVDQMCKTSVPDIYAVGDVAAFRDPKDNHTLPMLAQFAIRQGQDTADNILREVRGEELKPFVPHMHGEFVSVGPGWGVGWMWKWNLAGFPAIFMKRLTYVLYWYFAGGIPLAWKRTREMFALYRQ